MRLTQALHFYFGRDEGLTKSSGKVQYSHFVPTEEDYKLRAQIAREAKSKKVPKPRMVMEDLFD